jgi:hypothetical protein
MNQNTIAVATGDCNVRDEVKPPTFTPLRIGADGSRVPYDPPSFEQLRSDLLAGSSVVVMNGVDMRALYARHHEDNDPTAGYDNGQAELYCLLEAAVDTDPDIARLFIDVFSGDEEGLHAGETANGEPELAAEN